jgi:hypothetical protein
MADMHRASDDAAAEAKKAAHRRKKDREATLKGKTFEDLSPPEKDKLLKAVAVRLSLIDDSVD